MNLNGKLNWSNPLEKILCISDCARFESCVSISFNQKTRLCQYYNDYLKGETKLIESHENFLFYSDPPLTYQLRGVLDRKLTSSVGIKSLLKLFNDDIVCLNSGRWSDLIKLSKYSILVVGY